MLLPLLTSLLPKEFSAISNLLLIMACITLEVLFISLPTVTVTGPVTLMIVALPQVLLFS
jgi:hypothetical protein